MIIRPVDANDDILPVVSARDVVSGSEAVARLVTYKLSLLKGDWWENPEDGFFVLEFMREERFSEANVGIFASRVTGFIRGVEGVFEVDDVQFQVDGRVFRYSCRLVTEAGTAMLEYSFE